MASLLLCFPSVNKKKSPRLTSLVAHPISTYTVYDYRFLLNFSMMITKVKLFNSPMQPADEIYPTQGRNSIKIELAPQIAVKTLNTSILSRKSLIYPPTRLPTPNEINI